jgi:hypothetical protein
MICYSLEPYGRSITPPSHFRLLLSASSVFPQRCCHSFLSISSAQIILSVIFMYRCHEILAKSRTLLPSRLSGKNGPVPRSLPPHSPSSAVLFFIQYLIILDVIYEPFGSNYMDDRVRDLGIYRQSGREHKNEIYALMQTSDWSRGSFY